MAEEGFDALAMDRSSNPEEGIEDIMSELNTEQTPRDDRGRFAKPDGADDGDEAEESEPAEAQADAEDDAAPEEASGEEETDEEPDPGLDPGEAIDVPTSWSADAKEVFAKLPPEAQQIIAARESERETAVNARLAESAAERKAAQAERDAAQAERQHNAQFLTQVAAYARTMDPVIAQGMNTDWAALAREEGAEEAYARQQEFNQRVQHLQAVEAELQRINQDSVKHRRSTEEAALKEKLPDYADAAQLQSFKDSAAPILTEAGYSPQEIEAYWEHLPDHRQALVLKRLVTLEKREAERRAIAAKKAKSVPPKVQKPKAQQDAQAQEAARVTALRKQLDKDPGNIDVLTDLARITTGARQ